MDLLDRVGKKGGNKNSPDRMGLFQPQCRKAKTLLLAARIVEIISFGIHCSRFRCPLWIRRGSHTFTR
jgi:hypothetical protein